MGGAKKGQKSGAQGLTSKRANWKDQPVKKTGNKSGEKGKKKDEKKGGGSRDQKNECTLF